MTSPTAPAPMRVDRLLGELLEATAAKTAASRRIDRLRDVLDTEARRRYAAEGAAPTWKAPKLGSVRLDPKDAKAYVADADAFASYVAQRFPSEVAARIELDAVQLEAALEALTFAGVTVHRSAVEVRPSFVEALLSNAEVLYTEDPAQGAEPGKPLKVVARVVDGTLEAIDGTDVLPPTATLVVTLDRTRKAAELARVDEQLEQELPALGAGIELEPSLGEAVLEELDAPHSERTGVRLDRTPYVGEGADGARRSAEVDRAELDTLPTDRQGRNAAEEHRREQLVESIAAWEEQAARLEAEEHAAEVGERLVTFANVATGAVETTDQPVKLGAEVPVMGTKVGDDGSRVTDGGHGLPPGAPPYTARPGFVFAPQPGDPGYALTSPAPGGPELLPGGDPAPEASSLEPAADTVAAELAAESPIAVAGEDAHDPPRSAGAVVVPETTADDPVAALAVFGTDTLKRLARTKRVPVSGTKVLLAGRLHKAGVTADDARELEAKLAAASS